MVPERRTERTVRCNQIKGGGEALEKERKENEGEKKEKRRKKG